MFESGRLGCPVDWLIIVLETRSNITQAGLELMLCSLESSTPDFPSVGLRAPAVMPYSNHMMAHQCPVTPVHVFVRNLKVDTGRIRSQSPRCVLRQSLSVHRGSAQSWG